MAGNSGPIVSDEVAKKFVFEKVTPYESWAKNEGLDIISGEYIRNLRSLELKPWPQRGGKGVFITHDASRISNDCYVCEIPAGGKLAPQRQLYEEMVLILDGRGSTSVWNDAGRKVTFEWQAGSMFAIPLNCHHQHVNASGQEPARYVAVTNAPAVINLYSDTKFIFNTKYDFAHRFNGEADYFSGKGEQKGFLNTANAIADVLSVTLLEAKERGAAGGHIRFNMAKGSMSSHISQIPVGTYKKAHIHGPSAHIIILSGEGYTLMWPEQGRPERYEWGPGTLIVPPNRQFCQHFNTGPVPARYLALKHEACFNRNDQGVPVAWISRRVGGDQIDYADEDPEIRDMFAKALAKHALKSEMTKAYEAEMADLPAKPRVA